MHAKDARGVTPQQPSQSPPASAPPDADAEQAIEPLRAWGLRHPFVLELMATLEPASTARSGAEQLVWETAPVPGLVVNGERRVSILRLRSRTQDGDQLVGQVQVLQPSDDPLARTELALYVHAPDKAFTRHEEDADAWFTTVLDTHYDRASDPVELAPAPLPNTMLD